MWAFNIQDLILGVNISNNKKILRLILWLLIIAIIYIINTINRGIKNILYLNKNSLEKKLKGYSIKIIVNSIVILLLLAWFLFYTFKQFNNI